MAGITNSLKSKNNILLFYLIIYSYAHISYIDKICKLLLIMKISIILKLSLPIKKKIKIERIKSLNIEIRHSHLS